jgi:hypothetical protein
MNLGAQKWPSRIEDRRFKSKSNASRGEARRADEGGPIAASRPLRDPVDGTAWTHGELVVDLGALPNDPDHRADEPGHPLVKVGVTC